MKLTKPILQLAEDFLNDQDVCSGTRDLYRRTLGIFFRWLAFSGTRVNNIHRSDIIRYKQYLSAQNLRPTTINSYLSSVRLFFRWMEETGQYENVAAGVRSPRKYNGFRKEYLRPDDVSKLLAAPDRSKLTGKRDYAMLNLMVRLGLRCVEVSRLLVSDIVSNPSRTGFMIYVHGKGRTEKDAAIGITDKVMDPINDYLVERAFTEDRPLFISHDSRGEDQPLGTISISRIVKKYLRQIGLDSPAYTAHSLRHTAAVNALRAGVSIYDVQQLLRHSSITMTQIYLTSLQEEKRMDSATVKMIDNMY